MNTEISFTISQLVNMILGICGGITAIGAAIAVIINWVKQAKAPEQIQDDRLKNLEDRVNRHDELFARDQKRLESLEAGNRITQKALLALLSHGIDGNDIQALKGAKKELENYLIGGQ